MKHVLSIIAICVLVILASPAIAWTEEEPGPPPTAIQLLENPGFEEGVAPWELIGDASRTITPPILEGDYTLNMAGTNAWSLAMQEVDLEAAGCDLTGPVWIQVPFSWIVPPPLTDPGYDVWEGWLASGGIYLVDLWELYEWEYETDAAWQENWIRVDGLGEALGEDTTVQLWLGMSTNETPSYLAVDEVRFCCSRAGAVWMVYLPMVQR